MKILIGIFSVIVLSAGLAAAQTAVSYSQGGRALFTVEVPDFWSVRTGGPREVARPGRDPSRSIPRVLALEPTIDGDVWMGLMSPPAVTDLVGARAYLDQLGDFLALEAEVTAPATRRIAGRPAEVFAGTGRRDGRALQFTVAAIELPGERVAIVVAVLEAGADPAFARVLNGVFSSFRAVR